MRYRERIFLQPGSRLSVVLEDVSRADTVATQITSLELTDPGQVPIAFRLEYDPADIDERMSYALRARILAADGGLLFINDTHTPVITRDAGNHVDMVLVSVGRESPAPSEPRTSDDMTENTFGVDLKGEFSYLADAVWFRDCSSGKTFPVEMSHQFTDLERAYFNSGIKPGDVLTVKLRGRYLARPGMDTEQSFLLALNQANHVRVEGQFMELYEDETFLARFEAIYF